MRLLALNVVTGAALLFAAPAAHASPTCSTTLGIVVHGQHIVGDYITGIGHTALGWPPPGGVVGDAVAGQGAAIPGGVSVVSTRLPSGRRLTRQSPRLSLISRTQPGRQ